MDSQTLRGFGRLMFLLGWVPFAGIFIGMIGMPNGDYAWNELPLLTRTSLVLVALMFGGSGVLSALAGGKSTAQNLRLQTEGRLTEAIILDIDDTGTTVNNDPIVQFRLKVTPMDADPFEAIAQKRVSRIKLPGVQPGNTIQVRYDPATKQVAIADEANID